MYKGLYDKFANWFRGGNIWLYSDPHFGDEDMKYRGISDDEQVKRINAKVGKYDTIIFLGDIGNVEWIKRIRGYKVLIMGNHDAGASNYIDYFDEVYEGALIIGEKLLLSHEPVDIPWAFNIHGHDHAGAKRKGHLNICADAIGYTPINFNQFLKSGASSKIQTIHRETIDKATERKKKRGGRKIGEKRS